MSDPFSYNGGAMVGMIGKKCVAIGCDRRQGQQFQTINTNFQKVFKMQDNILLGLTGLATDVQTLWGPYFVQPIVVGLEDGKPYVATYDSIGTTSDSDPFQVGGTAGDGLIGSSESYWKPDMDEETLEEVVAQTLLSGADRDIMSGWGGIVYVITESEIKIKVLKTKQC